MSAVLRPGGSALGRPLIDAAFLHDPYPTYRALREAGIHVSESPAALGSTMMEVLRG